MRSRDGFVCVQILCKTRLTMFKAEEIQRKLQNLLVIEYSEEETKCRYLFGLRFVCAPPAEEERSTSAM